MASTRVALTLTLAWFASMDSIGNVVAPFIIDGIGKVMHVSTSTHPVFAFRICLWISLIALGIVIIRKIIVSARKDENRKHAVVSEAAQGPTSTSAASVNPVPSDIPLKKVSDTEMVEIGARNAVKAAEQADQAAEAAAEAAQKAATDAKKAAAAAQTSSDALEKAIEKSTGPARPLAPDSPITPDKKNPGDSKTK